MRVVQPFAMRLPERLAPGRYWVELCIESPMRGKTVLVNDAAKQFRLEYAILVSSDAGSARDPQADEVRKRFEADAVRCIYSEAGLELPD